MKNKREKILGVFISGDLLTAAEVCKRLKDVDRATIYRNIQLFVDQGILREVNVKKAVTSYEITKPNDEHQHFICECCEKVLPVDLDLQKVKQLLPKTLNFNKVEINLKGKCDDCC